MPVPLSLDVPPDDITQSIETLRALNAALAEQYTEMRRLAAATSEVNEGILLDDILNRIFEDFTLLLPYDRLGLGLLDHDTHRVQLRWKKTRYPAPKLLEGYEVDIAETALDAVLESRKPRVINDLDQYAETHGLSEAGQLIYDEGIRASLTCPLLTDNVVVGFLFFSSRQKNSYSTLHVERMQHMLAQLTVIVEKGRLVSELADQKVAMEIQNEELQRLSTLREQFIGMAAHDLRSPLATIQMLADALLEDDEIPADLQRTFLRDIATNADTMLDLLHDLLDTTQLATGRLTLNREAVDVSAFLTEQVQRHNQLATRKQSKVQLEPVPPGTLYADGLRLRQVMDNLLSNAVKFAPPDSIVRVEAAPTAKGWRVAVHDQGPGIPEAERSDLFQRFGKLSPQPTGDEQSYGLGLAITKQIIQAHGGTIGIDSEQGHGSTFWFELPKG